MSSLARALKNRPVPDWPLMVSCPKKHRDAVGRAASEMFGTPHEGQQ